MTLFQDLVLINDSLNEVSLDNCAQLSANQMNDNGKERCKDRELHGHLRLIGPVEEPVRWFAIWTHGVQVVEK